ncbi:MAG: TcpQ domain-containing protein [Alphaproteobacteria bacterium]|nr:TcpQ domain-containing protein [Alphaproteobacteria bacterium]
MHKMKFLTIMVATVSLPVLAQAQIVIEPYVAKPSPISDEFLVDAPASDAAPAASVVAEPQAEEPLSVSAPDPVMPDPAILRREQTLARILDSVPLPGSAYFDPAPIEEIYPEDASKAAQPERAEPLPEARSPVVAQKTPPVPEVMRFSDIMPDDTSEIMPVEVIETVPDTEGAQESALRAPPPPVMDFVPETNEPRMLFHADEGASMRQVLTEWSEQAGVVMVWDNAYDFSVQWPLDAEGVYPRAVEMLLDQHLNETPRPIAQLYIDPQTQERVLVISARES